jgi:hypothetical protein
VSRPMLRAEVADSGFHRSGLCCCRGNVMR